jgi:hypothetical protein
MAAQLELMEARLNMASTIQTRRDTLANWALANPTLAQGEIGIESDTRKMKFGDGATAWNSLPYFTGIASSNPIKGSAVVDFGNAPGKQRTTVTVNDANVLTASKVMVFIDPTATAKHNAYEHSMVPLVLSAGSIVNQTSFVITAICEWPLTGTFNVAYIINI